jgi:putative membrane protein
MSTSRVNSISRNQGNEAVVHKDLPPAITKNDRKAGWLIGIFSVVIFAAIVALGKIKLNVDLGFDPHLFAKANAVINSMVSVLLVGGLVAVKQGRYLVHKRIMFTALILSVLFLVSYICHHLFTGDTRYGGTGVIRYVYFIILITHIFLAAIILPFILFTAYRALISEWPRHVKQARITWPIWLYVSITGVIVYLMISPYYANNAF